MRLEIYYWQVWLTPPNILFYLIKIWKKRPSWRREQGLGLIFRVLEQEIQIKPNRSWKKRRNFWIWTLFTFCLIVSWVFIIETIAGSQIITFCPLVWYLVSDLRKMYRGDCQTMVSSTFRSQFCQFGGMLGAADLGGIEWSFWLFFAKIG